LFLKAALLFYMTGRWWANVSFV